MDGSNRGRRQRGARRNNEYRNFVIVDPRLKFVFAAVSPHDFIFFECQIQRVRINKSATRLLRYSPHSHRHLIVLGVIHGNLANIFWPQMHN